MEFTFGLLGMFGGILCAVGDILFDLKGNDSQKLGKYKFIESNWDKMPLWRFKTSILLAAVGVPLYVLGFISMAIQISDKAVSVAFGVISCLGALGGIMIHTLCCITPILYKSLKKHTKARLFPPRKFSANRRKRGYKIAKKVRYIEGHFDEAKIFFRKHRKTPVQNASKSAVSRGKIISPKKIFTEQTKMG